MAHNGGMFDARRGSPEVPRVTSEDDRPEPVLGLALGGGGARGLCHIGVMRVLEEFGIRPDVVSGTSMGGLIGAFIAAGYNADQMTDIATDLRWSKLIDWSPISGRLVNTKGFERWLAELLPATFEELELPLVLTATDLNDGRIHYSQHGDLITALRATTARGASPSSGVALTIASTRPKLSTRRASRSRSSPSGTSMWMSTTPVERARSSRR